MSKRIYEKGGTDVDQKRKSGCLAGDRKTSIMRAGEGRYYYTTADHETHLLSKSLLESPFDVHLLLISLLSLHLTTSTDLLSTRHGTWYLTRN